MLQNPSSFHASLTPPAPSASTPASSLSLLTSALPAVSWLLRPATLLPAVPSCQQKPLLPSTGSTAPALFPWPVSLLNLSYLFVCLLMACPPRSVTNGSPFAQDLPSFSCRVPGPGTLCEGRDSASPPLSPGPEQCLQASSPLVSICRISQ